MSHADSGTLMAYLDGALPERERNAVEAHVRDCRPCTESCDELRAAATEFAHALALVDGPVPMLEARVRLQHVAAVAQDSGRRPRWRAVPADLLKAAAVVLLLAGAASAAIPGSPIRQLVDRALRAIQGEPVPVRIEEAPAVEAVPPSAPVQPPSPTGDVAVDPVNGQARVSIHSPGVEAQITVRLVDGEKVTVFWSSDDADTTRFGTGPGFIDVYQVQSAVVVEIPRSVARATVDVDGNVYYLKDGDDLQILGPGAEKTGDDVVFQARL